MCSAYALLGWILVQAPCHFVVLLLHVNEIEIVLLFQTSSVPSQFFYYKHQLPMLHQMFFHMNSTFSYMPSFCLGAQQERPLFPGKLWESCFFM